jgi:structural maintenance of chromosome 1
VCLYYCLGKSNILDAISFVFGVRSSSLRGVALSDLIHKTPEELESNRSVYKNCYVLLVYVDEQGNELSFQRSITKEGLSEYRFNNKKTSW